MKYIVASTYKYVVMYSVPKNGMFLLSMYSM